MPERVKPSVLSSLQALRQQLETLDPYPWAAMQAWAAAARPVMRAHLTDQLTDFESEVKAPQWAQYPYVSGEDRYSRPHDNFAEADAAEERDNRQLAAERKVSIAAFLDGLIEVVRHDSSQPSSDEAVQRVRLLVDGFERFCRALARRGRERDAVIVVDEYDVQYLFNALLRLVFDDVRPEEATPSRGGGRAQMDFLVKSERLVIELKMTRDGLTDRAVTDELLIDIGRYRSHPDCATLLCFVYDPPSS